MPMFELVPITIFRNTPDVFFYDATITGTNGCDVVTHGPMAISPPNDEEFPTFYVHYDQVDHNLCVHGLRRFELINKSWSNPYHIIMLNARCGSLRIPVGTYHRSISGNNGSVLINQPYRTDKFDVSKEFIPVSTRDDKELYEIITTVEPIIHKAT